MGKTHWKQLQNNDWIGAYALSDGQDLTLTIDKAQQEQVTGNNGKREMCLTVHWMERDYKPMIVNRTNAKTITKVTGSPYIEDWHGRKITLYVDTTRLGGDIVECLRVRPYAPKQAATRAAEPSNTELICEKCGTAITAAYSKSAEEVAEQTKAKYGKRLCAKCAREANAGA